MSRVVALAGPGDGSGAAPTTPSPQTMLLWGVVLGTTVGIFIGTLMLNPSRKRS